jgi:lysophospholipase L1-like esterase
LVNGHFFGGTDAANEKDFAVEPASMAIFAFGFSPLQLSRPLKRALQCDPMNRRELLTSVSAIVVSSLLDSPASAQTKPVSTAPVIPSDLDWHDVRQAGIEGRGFNDTENYFDRLPARAKDIVRPEVWGLSHDSSGMSVDFVTDADAIYVRYVLVKESLAMPHMPATGVSGLDLYSWVTDDWHWAATLQPRTQKIEAALIQRMPRQQRRFRIHLPLYNGVKSFEIGVPRGSTIQMPGPRPIAPILFYGTSITQGGCASRPGMAFPSILGRRLARPILNFGFSGNGRMEVEVAKFLAELDPKIYVLDCLANMANLPITQRTEAVVRLLRESRPDTPILIVEERPPSDAAVLPHRLEAHIEHCAELRAAFDNLTKAGVKHLHYRTGDDLIGNDGEATVDGSHPTDLGMVRYADALEGDLKKLLY